MKKNKGFVLINLLFVSIILGWLVVIPTTKVFVVVRKEHCQHHFRIYAWDPSFANKGIRAFVVDQTKGVDTPIFKGNKSKKKND